MRVYCPPLNTTPTDKCNPSCIVVDFVISVTVDGRCSGQTLMGTLHRFILRDHSIHGRVFILFVSRTGRCHIALLILSCTVWPIIGGNLVFLLGSRDVALQFTM
jgi:hypothetical protein